MTSFENSDAVTEAFVHANEPVTDAYVAARQKLRNAGSELRSKDFFTGIDLAAINEEGMLSIRLLICGVLSKLDKIPWSSNGRRVLANGTTVYLGTISNLHSPRRMTVLELSANEYLYDLTLSIL